MNDDHRDDDPIETAAPPADQPKTGRRSEPWPIHANPDEPTPACLAAARHVAECPRCFGALQAHIADTIAMLLATSTNGRITSH